jgi:outer membrane protein assembly factor BamB
MNSSGVISYRFDEIAVWRTKLPKAEHAVLPPTNNRPNPLVTESMVYASVFSPGAICALERKTGKLVWRREVPKFGGSAVHFAQGKLFATTANTLYALEPDTGKTIWSFCPYGESGESIYSAPAIHRNSLFIGDRRGYLHCLNSRTGTTAWKQRTNRAKNCDMNSTPVVVNELVIVGTNAKMAAAYDARTGKRVWARRLDGPSVFGPLLCRGLLAVFTHSTYLLRPEEGEVVRRFTWKGDGVSHAESTPRGVVVILRGSWPSVGHVRLIGLDESGIRFTETCSAFVAFLRYAAETGMIYVSHLEGIDVRRPESGVLACKIERKNGRAGNGPADVKRNTIYVLTSDGYIYALRHPGISPRRERSMDFNA